MHLLLLARLMGQYCFVGWRLSSSIVVCNAAGGWAGRPPGAWTVGAPAAGAWAVGRRHCTAGQSCYVPLGRHVV